MRVSGSRLSSSDLDDSERIVDGLDALRNCGDESSLAAVVNFLIHEGPVNPVAQLSRRVDVTSCTRTNLLSTLAFYKTGLDGIHQDALERHVQWALDRLRDAELQMSSVPFDLLATKYLIPCLEDAYRLVEHAARGRIRRHLLELPPNVDRVLADAYADLVRSIPTDEWTDEERGGLVHRVPFATREGDQTEFSDRDSLGRAFGAILAHTGDAERLAALHQELADGNWQNLSDLGDIASIPIGVAAQLVTHLTRDLEERSVQAASGTWIRPGVYSGEVLLLINLAHPALAQWDPICGVLEGAGAWDQAQLARRLSVLEDRIDEVVAHQLEPLLAKLAVQEEVFLPFRPRSDEAARSALLRLAARDSDPSKLVGTLSAGPAGRIAVAQAIGRRRAPSDIALLASLSVDADSRVRAASSAAAATWLQSESQVDVEKILRSLLESGGYANAYATMRAIKHEAHSEAIHLILEKLVEHPSARVRWRASELLRDPMTCRCRGL